MSVADGLMHVGFAADMARTDLVLRMLPVADISFAAPVSVCHHVKQGKAAERDVGEPAAPQRATSVFSSR
jgi:hypothetical protein